MLDFLHGAEVIEITDGVRPIRTVRTGVIGVIGTAPDADAATFPLDTPVLVAGSRAKAALLDTVGDGRGTLPSALDGIFDQVGAAVIVVRVDEGTDETATLANVIGGTNAGTGQALGLHAFAAAKSITGFTPKIICAPGFTHQRPSGAANPVVAEALGILDRLRAIMVIDGPNTNDADAIAARGDWGSKRLYMIDPAVKVGADGARVEWASARVAGVIARIRAERGYWWSPSNQVVNGIVGTARSVDFTMGDKNSRANLLNEQEVTTIIREEGFRVWGNRGLSSDPNYAFISHVAIDDTVAQSILDAHLWAVDRNISSSTYFEEVSEGVNAFIRRQAVLGALFGGECFPDPDLNSAASIADGHAWWNVAISRSSPAERLTFRLHVTNEFIEEVLP